MNISAVHAQIRTICRKVTSSYLVGPRFVFSLVLASSIVFIATSWGTALVLHRYSRQTSTPGQTIRPATELPCTAIEDKVKKTQCWEKQLDTLLAAKGLEAAFLRLDELYKTQPDFASDCHAFTHKMGEAGYKLFSQTKTIGLTEKASYCGYGFYHGFMEALVQSTKDLDQARLFCAKVDEQMLKKSQYSAGACYHGIGHGVVDGSDPRAQGDAEKIITPGLALCQKVSNDNDKLYRCGSGVFNSVALMFNAKDHGLSINEKNPYWLCQKQTEEQFITSCYDQMNTSVMQLGNGSFAKAITYVEHIAKPSYAMLAMQGLASAAGAENTNGSDPTEDIETCKKTKDYLIQRCINGLAAGLAEHGTPGREYIKALGVCQSQAIASTRQQACLEATLYYLRVIYPPAKYQDACVSLPPSDQHYCTS